MAKNRKTTKIEAAAVQNMTTSVAGAEDAALSELMAILGADPAAVDGDADEVIEPAAAELPVFDPNADVPIPAVPTVSHEDLAGAVAAAESIDAMIAAATPEGAGVDLTDTPAVDPDAAAVEAADKPKKVPVPRKHYTNKAERIKDRLGEALPEFVSALTLDDAAKLDSEEAVTAATAETMTLIAGMSKKKQNRAGFLLEFVSGKKDKLNNVMAIAFSVLRTAGFLTTGKDGNYLSALLAVPYSPAAARAMGGNTIAVLEDLKLIVADGKGRYVGNPESLLLAKVVSMLAAAPAAVDAGEPEGDDAGAADETAPVEGKVEELATA